MGVLIGMDEAGYGPNLGPLVIGVTKWRFDGRPSEVDLWSALEDAIAQKPKRGDDRLHVADSKEVYNSNRGIGSLERTVLATLRVLGHQPTTFGELHRAVLGSEPASEPWFEDDRLELPLANDESAVNNAAARLGGTLTHAGISLEAMRCDVVLTRRYNELVEKHDSKGIALSTTSMNLLRAVWDVDLDDRTRVIADKHGGRNRYDELLEDVVGDRMIFRVQEGRDRSVYRVGQTELVFRTKAEQHLPVALASMVAKYVREVAMELFNQFWADRVPDLKPTKGYPVDAVRFRKEIASSALELGLVEGDWWRSR